MDIMDIDKLRKIKIKDTNLAELILVHQRKCLIQNSESYSCKDRLIKNIDLSNIDKDRLIENIDLSNIDLSGADLRYFTFLNVNFENAYLKETIFSGSTFKFVNFKNADMRRSKLTVCEFYNCSFDKAFMYECDISKSSAVNTSFKDAAIEFAILKGVNFKWNVFLNTSFLSSNLEYSDLSGSTFKFADLRNCNLMCSDMTASNFEDTNFAKANLKNATLNGCNFCGVYDLDKSEGKNNYIEGKVITDNIIGYKKCKNDIIVTLEIPRGAIVFSINGNKCRTNKAKVIAIDGADRAYSKRSTYSEHSKTYGHMSYYVGDQITVYNFNCKYNEECSQGIHFFLTREEAEAYEFY